MGVPLDIQVEIAPDADPDGDPQYWGWLDVSGYRRATSAVNIKQGRDDEAAQVEPGKASTTFDLRDGLLSPRNPYSDLYGRIGINTPIRYRLPIFEDTFTRTGSNGLGTSDSGGVWSSIHSSWSVDGSSGVATLAAANTTTATHVTGAAALDVDITYSVTPPVVTTGAPWISALEFRRVDADNMYRVYTELKPAGVITIKLVRVLDGTSTDLGEVLSTGVTYAASTRVWTRVIAEGGLMRAKLWTGTKSAEPDDWTLWGTLTTIQGGEFGLLQWRYVGNTNVGSLAVKLDDFTATALLWSGNVPEWPPGWDKSGNDSFMEIAAAGPIRRLNQGDDPLKCPLTRQLPSFGPAAYWPCDDGTDATAGGNAVSGGKPLVATGGCSFGQDDTPPGGAASVKLDTTSSLLRGKVTADSTGDFSAMLFVKLASLPAGETTVVEWRATTGTMRRWIVKASATGWLIKIYDDTGALLHDGGTVVYVDPPTEWTAIQLEVQQTGGNAVWSFIWNQLDSNTFYSVGASTVGTSAKLSEVYIPGSTGMTDALITQIWIGPNTLPFVDDGFLDVSRGYAGELAWQRIDRLCDEQGVPVTFVTGTSEPMGAQRIGRFLDLLREAADADLGILYERAGSMAYVPRTGRYNVPVKLALEWAQGDLAEAPKPTDDDQRLRNRWTVKRTGGSEATYENTASIARHGAVGDSAEINIETDDRLSAYAGWMTALTTLDEMRWPTIELDLVGQPELIPEFLSCRIGDRITISNPKDQVAGIEIDLIIEGIDQTINQFQWDVTLTCSPASAWKVAEWTGGDRYGALTTTLNTAEDETSTAWSITTTSVDEKWSTTASGYEWDIAGETVEVVSIAAATGTGPYVQAVVVIRSKNGVVKQQQAGTPVKMKAKARWAL
jgi:hypothetical protein